MNFFNCFKRAYSTKGFTLIEILISLMLFVLIISAIFTYFSTVRKGARREINRSEAVENARIGLESIVNDLKKIGLNTTYEQHRLLYGDHFQIIFNADLDGDLRNDPNYTGPIFGKVLYRLGDFASPQKRFLMLYSTNPTPLIPTPAPILTPTPAATPGIGAETVRYSLDYRGQGYLTIDSLEDNCFVLAGLDKTENPYDFYLIKEVWGSYDPDNNPNNGNEENTYSGLFEGGPKIIATVRGWVNDLFTYPNRTIVYPLFSYWGHFEKDDVNHNPGDPGWNEPLDLLGDLDNDNVLSDAEILEMYHNIPSVRPTWLPEPNPTVTPFPDWSWDVNGNGCWDSTLDDIVYGVYVSVTAETRFRVEGQVNEARSAPNDKYYFFDTRQTAFVKINNPRYCSPIPVNETPSQFTPTPYYTPTPGPTTTGTPATATPPPATNTPQPSTPTPQLTPGTTPTQSVPPPKMAEVAIASQSNTRQDLDVVKIWAINQDGTKFQTPLVILSDNPAETNVAPVNNPYPIAGQVVDMEVSNLAGGTNNYWDLVVATHVNNPQGNSKNLFIFKNLTETTSLRGLQYELNDAVQLGINENLQIEQVECGDVDHDGRDEIIVGFTSFQGLTITQIRVYEVNILLPNIIRLGPELTNFRITILGSLQFMKAANLFYENNESGAIHGDDLIIVYVTGQANHLGIYTSVSDNNSREFENVFSRTYPTNITDIEVGEFFVLPISQQMLAHLDLAVAFADGTLKLFKNLSNLTNQNNPTFRLTLEETHTYNYPISDLISANMFVPHGYSDLAVLLNSTNLLEPNLRTIKFEPGQLPGQTQITYDVWTTNLIVNGNPVKLGEPAFIQRALRYVDLLIGLEGISNFGTNVSLILIKDENDPQGYRYIVPSPPYSSSNTHVIANSNGPIRSMVFTQHQFDAPPPNPNAASISEELNEPGQGNRNRR